MGSAIPARLVIGAVVIVLPLDGAFIAEIHEMVVRAVGLQPLR